MRSICPPAPFFPFFPFLIQLNKMYASLKLQIVWANFMTVEISQCSVVKLIILDIYYCMPIYSQKIGKRNIGTH